MDTKHVDTSGVNTTNSTQTKDYPMGYDLKEEFIRRIHRALDIHEHTKDDRYCPRYGILVDTTNDAELFSAYIAFDDFRPYMFTGSYRTRYMLPLMEAIKRQRLNVKEWQGENTNHASHDYEWKCVEAKCAKMGGLYLTLAKSDAILPPPIACPHDQGVGVPCVMCAHHQSSSSDRGGDCMRDSVRKITYCQCDKNYTMEVEDEELVYGEMGINGVTKRVYLLERNLMATMLLLEQLETCLVDRWPVSDDSVKKVQALIVNMKRDIGLPPKYNPDTALVHLRKGMVCVPRYHHQ